MELLGLILLILILVLYYKISYSENNITKVIVDEIDEITFIEYLFTKTNFLLYVILLSLGYIILDFIIG